MAVIALDLGGTKIAGAIISADGDVMFSHKNLLKGRKGDEVGALIVENLTRLLNKARYHKINIRAVGVCVPGSVEPITGRVWAPNIPGWEDFPLRDLLKSAIKDDEINVYIDNDRICYVYGEMWQGAAKNCKNVIFIAVGTGIGAGIIVDGKAIHGASNIIGATGWMALEPPYKKEYDAAGCFEYYASGAGICNRAKEAVRDDKTYRGKLRQMPITRITTNDVFNVYPESDPIALTIIHKAIQMWGMGASNLVSLLNPEMIIWGGGVFGPAQVFIDEIYEEAKKWAQPISINQVSFVPSKLSGQAGLMGAGYIALNNINAL